MDTFSSQVLAGDPLCRCVVHTRGTGEPVVASEATEKHRFEEYHTSLVRDAGVHSLCEAPSSLLV